MNLQLLLNKNSHSKYLRRNTHNRFVCDTKEEKISLNTIYTHSNGSSMQQKTNKIMIRSLNVAINSIE